MWQVVSALATVLGAIIVLRVLLRAGGFGGASSIRRRLNVLETVSLGGKQRLHVVDVGGEQLLLASGENRVSLLRRLPELIEAEPAQQEQAPEPEDRAKRSQLGWAWLRVLVRSSWIAVLVLLMDSSEAMAEAVGELSPAQISLSLDGVTAPERISSSLQVVAILTLISVAPSILLMGTCFTRILIVMTLLRQAMGIHQIPPNQVLAGLAFFTTLFVMAPVGERIYDEALLPYMEREIDAPMATQRALVPVREYLIDHTREKDLLLFVELSGEEVPEEPSEVSLATLMPAYMISELRTAFEIGFMIYLPFMMIDLMIASMLISLGMIVLPPMMIALPFKLMLFVLLDGWNLILSSLVTGLL